MDDLRFQKTTLPTGTSSTVNNGSDSVICMQAYPSWIIALQAEMYGVSAEVMEEILWTETGQTESCLVLDVRVPEKIFNNGSASGETAPSVYWNQGWRLTSLQHL